MLVKGWVLLVLAAVRGEADTFRSMQLDNGIEYEELTTPFVKSESDTREYQGFVLSNKMKVLLVSDPKADLAAAALDVAVGSMADPSNMPGLAHFCEHLLFMGNKKYPNQNDYFEHLKSNGGMANAFTGYDHTNYFFSVNHDSLETTLDRFAQFFVSPLFSEESVEKEVNAVHSEHKKNLQSDLWRVHQVQLSTLNKSHPFSHFATGTYDTLFKIPKSVGIDPRKEIIKYYNRYYSANQMRLVVLGRESIEELKRMAVTKFSNVRNTDAKRPSIPESPFSDGTLGVQIDIVPVGTGQSMTMQFPLPSQLDLYREKPTQYISTFLGHEGPGSVMAYLKKQGWCTSLVSEVSENFLDFSVLDVTFELTPTGLQNKDTIAQLMLEYIQLVKDNGITKEYFNEMLRITEISFRFQEKSDPARYTSALAGLLHSPAPFSTALQSALLMSEYNPTLLQEMFGYLTESNLRLSVIAKSAEADMVEPWYGTRYSVKPLPAYQPTGIKLHLPTKNMYIPDDFTLLKTNPEVKLLRNTTQSILWYAGNPTNTPKASIRLLLKNTIVSSSPSMQTKMEIFVEAIKIELSAFGYSAALAGLSYKVEAKSSGISIFVEGYNQKMELFLADILRRIDTLEFSSPTFALCKDKRLQDLANLEFSDPYKQAVYNTQVGLTQNVWPYGMIVAATQGITYSQATSFAKTMLHSTQLEMLVIGNMDRFAANRIMDTCVKTLKPQPPSEQHLHPVRSVILPKGNLVTQVPLKNQENPNSAIVFYMDTYAYPDKVQSAQTQLLGQLLSEPAFNQLRTKEQLGYIVSSQHINFNNRGGILILVQSEQDPVYVESRIENLLQEFQTALESLPDERFQHQVNALKSSLVDKQRNLKETADFYWKSIYSGYYDFHQERTTATILDQVKKSQLLDLLTTSISHDSLDRKKFSTHMVSSLSRPHKGSNYTLMDCGTEVINATQWREKRSLSPFAVPLKE